MSLKTRQYNEQKSLNSHRRYVLEPPIHSATNNDYIQKPINYSDNKNNHIYLPKSSLKTTQYFEPNLNKSSHNDPWVNALLERDIDFSKLYQQETQVQFLPTSNTRLYKNDSKNSSQTNRPFPKWIIESPNNLTTQSNHFPINKDKFNSRILQKTIINEEESLIEQQKTSTKYKNQSQNENDENKTTYHGKNLFKNIWYLFTGKEKRNILIYIIGLMLYKFGLEAFNGSIVSLASNRYDRDASQSGGIARTFEKLGLLVGLNQACQCIGSILISPMIKHFQTRIILSISIFLFSLCTALLMIIDASTGGKIKPSNFQSMYENDYSYYGKYQTNIIIPIYCITGITYGMVELIRRIIPQHIVGTNEEKLKKMDALVHIFYELSGVTGALLTGVVLIPRLGNNYSFIITPILFTLSAIIWFFIKSNKKEKKNFSNKNKKGNFFKNFINGFYLFGKSIYLGGKIIFTNRKYIWLFPCYALELYVHRYIENGIAPQIAKRYLQNSEWSQIIVAGSNSGEFIGAILVFFLTKKIRSPIPWLRLDCILLLIIWYIPFYNPSSISIKNAWIIALTFIPFGIGSAGDDISLNAHIQSSLDESDSENEDMSSLSCVMAFLYSSYIILYAILNPLLGKYIDQVYNTNQTIRPAFIYTAGVQVTIISIIMAISTFIPRGSFKFNPSLK